MANVQDSDVAEKMQGTSGIVPKCVIVWALNKYGSTTFRTMQATSPMHWAWTGISMLLGVCVQGSYKQLWVLAITLV